jgi:hypothetical protein
MFGFIRRLFGQGRVRIEFDYFKGNQLYTASAKVPYQGQWNEAQCLVYARDHLIVEHGIHPVNMKVVGHIQG